MKKPFRIGIGGAHSGAGKTTLAVAILKYLTKGVKGPRGQGAKNLIAEKVIPLNPRTPESLATGSKWGAIKYTKTAFYASIIDDHTILRQENKDTRRLIDAGAEEVLWVQSPQNELHEVLPIAVNRLSHLDGIIIEGNSAIEFLKPDIVVFIAGVSKGKIKPSAHKIQKQADIIIKEESPKYSSQNIKELINCIEMITKKKEIKNILKERSTNGITCSDAKKIAEEIGIPYKEVGKTANELRIKIKDCELGCF